MKQTFWLDPIRRSELLRAILEALSGSAQVAVEVEDEALDRLGLLSLPGARLGLCAPFSRHGAGRMVVLPLKNERDVDEVSRALAPGLKKPVQLEAIQVERDGNVEFLAADEFHHECVSVGPAVPEELLATLARQGIIRGFCTPSEARERLRRPRR